MLIKIRRRIVLLVLFVIVVYLILGLIPFFQGKEIHVNEHNSYVHHQDKGYYRLVVEPAEYYTFYLYYQENNDIDPQIRLFSNSFKTVGIQKESTTWGQISIGFYAKHGGHYFVTVTNSKGGHFATYLDKYYDQAENLNPIKYVSSIRLTLVISIAVVFLSGVILSLKNYSQSNKNEKLEWKIKNTTTCPTCRSKYVKGVQYCTVCGYTFEKPTEYKDY